jgi:hypothetical protein
VSSFDSSSWPSVGDLPASPPEADVAAGGAAGGGPSPIATTPPPRTAPPWLQPYPTGPAPEPPGPPVDRRRVWAIAAAVAAVVVLVAAAIVGYRIGQPADQAAPATTAAPTTSTLPPEPSSTPAPSSAPSTTAAPSTTSSAPSTADAELNATVSDIEKFVEQQRGLTFDQPVVAKELDDQAFTDKLLSEETDEDRQNEAKSGDQLKALGLLPPGTDFVDVLHKSLSAGVVGFYDPETKELYVRGTDLGPYQRTTLAHELTHALDDQHFGLDRKQYDTDKGEISFGFSSLAEGNATRVQHAYFSQLSTADKREYQKAESLIGNNGELDDVPAVVQDLQAAPYQLGEALVADILKRGGQPALDQAFVDPPTTSEEVIDPSKYASREGAAHVDVPPADGPVETDGAIGELITNLVLSPAVGNRTATQASTGWGGDWSVLYTAGSQLCIRVDYVMDTPGDLQELSSAFSRWAASGSGRTVQSPDPGKVRVTSCVPK